jgi:hypothetical protein
MASPALGAVAAVGSAKAPIQLAGTPELKALVREAAYLHGTTTSTLLRRALIFYVGLAEGVPTDLAASIKKVALRQDQRRCNGNPLLRDDVSSALLNKATQLELDSDSATPARPLIPADELDAMSPIDRGAALLAAAFDGQVVAVEG